MEILLFVLHGLLGAFLNVLLWAEKLEDLSEFTTLKLYIIGALSGYIYYLLYKTYSFPDGFMAIIFGYFSKDLITIIFDKLKVIIGG